MLAALLALISVVSAICGWPGFQPCDTFSDDACDYNILTQKNIAESVSGQAFFCNGCSGNVGSSILSLEQNQMDLAVIMGYGNNVYQSNKAEATGSEQNQFQDNSAMIAGYSNDITQTNDALANSWSSGDGEKTRTCEAQTQKNLMLVIGANNNAIQSNTAKALSDSLILPAFPVIQTQKNFGLLLGKENRLFQSNDAQATMLKLIDADPVIRQLLNNIALALNNCPDCKVDATHDSTWPIMTSASSTIPKIIH
ncbi:MAG TPA: hypothetical protein PKK11_07225 [Methanothrix sp.]|nr:hypothetical protein [Methanothrix sp.]